jgi:type I restriction enzyme R subunit
VVQYTDYTAEKVKTLFSSPDELRDSWADPIKREEVMHALEERGIQFSHLANEAEQPDADPLDLLCHIAFDAPLRTRKQRAEYLRKNKLDFFDQYGPEAKAVLNILLDKYTQHGPKQFVIPDTLQIPPISNYGNVMEIAEMFGGASLMKEAVDTLQTLLYSNGNRSAD